MNAFTWIAEQRISAAIKAGEFKNLPGEGKPLNLDDDFDNQSGTGLAYKILKNAGFLPVSLLLRKEIENGILKKQALIKKCRARLTSISRLVIKEFEKLHSFFDHQSNLMAFFEIVSLPHFLKLEKTATKWGTVEFKRKNLDVEKEKVLRLISLYERTICDYRENYLGILNEINQRIAEFNFNRIKEEIRQGENAANSLMIYPLDVAQELREFDSEFQSFRY